MPTPEAVTYKRPGQNLVMRIQDDTVAGGPESTLMVGLSNHCAAWCILDGRKGMPYRNCDELEAALLTPQRWDQGLRRWRSLTPTESEKFNNSLYLAARGAK